MSARAGFSDLGFEFVLYIIHTLAFHYDDSRISKNNVLSIFNLAFLVLAFLQQASCSAPEKSTTHGAEI